jgi:hypothetical protein
MYQIDSSKVSTAAVNYTDEAGTKQGTWYIHAIIPDGSGLSFFEAYYTGVYKMVRRKASGNTMIFIVSALKRQWNLKMALFTAGWCFTAMVVINLLNMNTTTVPKTDRTKHFTEAENFGSKQHLQMGILLVNIPPIEKMVRLRNTSRMQQKNIRISKCLEKYVEPSCMPLT